MPRILIAGCGYVGQATADLFQAAGWLVEGWTASPESAAALAFKPYPVIACDATDPAAVASRGGSFDAIVQCTSSGGGGADDYRRVYLRAAENLRRTFAPGTLLFTSSTSVYAQRAGEWVDEGSAAEPERETGKVLRETEDVVLAHEGIVARLAGIYGPQRSALLQKFLRGETSTTNDGERFVNYAHRDDIAAALFLLITRRADLPGERIYNVVDDSPKSIKTCHEALARLLNRPLPAPTSASAVRKRSDSNKRVSNAKLRALGWRPRYATFEVGMKESVLPDWKS